MRERSSGLTRRELLVGAATLAALGVTASACASSTDPTEPDPLEAQRDLAVRDSQLATSAAAAAGPFYAPLLNVVADERAEHAEALSKEIARLADTATSSTPTPPATSTSTAPARTRNDVVAALRESAAKATELAEDLDGYRAGLLGSIAASCTASATVSLTLKENPS